MRRADCILGDRADDLLRVDRGDLSLGQRCIDISLIPANLRAAFNINDFTQLASFLSSELLGVILPLILPFFGIIILSNVVAGAEERGRLDVLLGNPIPRWNLIVGTFAVVAAFLSCWLQSSGRWCGWWQAYSTWTWQRGRRTGRRSRCGR